MPSSCQRSSSSVGNGMTSQHLNASPRVEQTGGEASAASGSSFLEWRVNQQTGVAYQVLFQPAVQQFQRLPHFLPKQPQFTPQQPHFTSQQQPAHSVLRGHSVPQPLPYRSPQFPETGGQPAGCPVGGQPCRQKYCWPSYNIFRTLSKCVA